MQDFFVTHGIWALGIMVLIDDIGIPIFPNAIALFTAATLAPNIPEMYIWKYFLVAICAAQTGNALLFYGGRHGLQKWIKQHHLRFMPSEERLAKFQQFFDKKHGAFTILSISCVTTMRPFSALIAGATGMSPWKFFPFNFLGILIWASTVTIVGYYIGESVFQMIQTDGRLVLAAFIVIATYWYFWTQFPWKHFRNNKK